MKHRRCAHSDLPCQHCFEVIRDTWQRLVHTFLDVSPQCWDVFVNIIWGSATLISISFPFKSISKINFITLNQVDALIVSYLGLLFRSNSPRVGYTVSLRAYMHSHPSSEQHSAFILSFVGPRICQALCPMMSCLIISYNIIQIHNNVLWDWQYYVEHFFIQIECEEYFVKYCQSHITLLWNWIMLCKDEEIMNYFKVEWKYMQGSLHWHI